MKLLKPIVYLEESDLNSNGTLKNGKPTLIMIQGNFCGFCNKAKPDYQKVGNKMHGKCTIATIQIDGESPDQGAIKLLEKKLQNYKGVPHYCGFNKQGKLVNHEGGRDAASIEKFAKTLI